jgi:hypothetical protein
MGVDMQGFVFEYDYAFDLPRRTSVTFSTAGDPDALLDLTTERLSGSVYIREYTEVMDNIDPDPILKRLKERHGGEVAVTINLKFLAEVVAKQVSPQIAQTRVSVSPDVTLETISLGYREFETFAGSRDGLMIKFTVGVDVGPGADVDGRVHLLAYLNEPDGTTAFVTRFPNNGLCRSPKSTSTCPSG